MRSFAIISLIALICILTLLAGLAAPGKEGDTLIPWSLYQRALRFQVMAPGVEVPREELILFCTTAPTRQQLEQMISAGYTLEAVVGRTILVSAPITLYIDQEQGLDAWEFVSLASMEIENSLNLPQIGGTEDWIDMFEPVIDCFRNCIEPSIYGYRLTE